MGVKDKRRADSLRTRAVGQGFVLNKKKAGCRHKVATIATVSNCQTRERSSQALLETGSVTTERGLETNKIARRCPRRGGFWLKEEKSNPRWGGRKNNGGGRKITDREREKL